MKPGMAVNSGNLPEKVKLAETLDMASLLAKKLDLWVNGSPAAEMFYYISEYLKTA